jgi:hypothetical protein
MQEAEANDAGGQGVPRVLHHGQPVVTDAEPAQSLEPTDRSLDHPAELPQAAAVRRLPPGDVRLNGAGCLEPLFLLETIAPNTRQTKAPDT